MSTGITDEFDIDLDDHSPGAERRQEPRQPIRLGVRFSSAQDLAHAMRSSTKNIGLGGLCLLTQKSYERGTRLEVTIELGAGEAMRVGAEVAWARPGKAIGVRFLDLDDAQRERLKRLIGDAAASGPAPRPAPEGASNDPTPGASGAGAL